MNYRFLFVITFLGVLVWLTMPRAALAVNFNFSFESFNATADFETAGGNLQITLTNTGAADVTGSHQVLTAIFFDIAGNPALTPISAALAPGSTVIKGFDGGGNVGGEWVYRSDLSGAPSGASQGISSAGFGLGFGRANFGGPNLEGPEAVDGPQYGLTSALDNPDTYFGRTTPLIKNSAVFTLFGLPPNFVLEQDISNVTFQYGTRLGPPNSQTASLLLLRSNLISLAIIIALGLIGFLVLKPRKV